MPVKHAFCHECFEKKTFKCDDCAKRYFSKVIQQKNCSRKKFVSKFRKKSKSGCSKVFVKNVWKVHL